jgi:hypothetical protein
MKKAFFALALFVALAAVTGCLGGDVEAIDADISPDAEPVDTNRTGDEILASAVDAADSAEAYAVEGKSRYHFGASQFFNVNVTMESTSRFNTPDEEAVVETEGDTDFSLLGFFDNTTEFETTVYSQGNLTQRRVVEGGDDTGWSEAEGNYTMTERAFGSGAVSWVTNGTTAELLGEETVNGDETYALRVNVSRDTYRNIFVHSTVAVGLGAGGLDEREPGEEGPEQPEDGEFNLTESTAPDVYLWVNKETGRPVRLAYLLSVDSQDSGGNGGEDSISAAFSMMYEADYSYEDVEVEPPDGV